MFEVDVRYMEEMFWEHREETLAHQAKDQLFLIIVFAAFESCDHSRKGSVK